MTMNSISFGSLTACAAQSYRLFNLDFNNDGIIDFDEFLKAFEQIEYDSLDISVIDKNKDEKVTKEEFDMWTQEEKINKLCDEYKTKVAVDFAGEDNDDILKFLASLDDFKQEFIKQYIKDMKDISQLAERFAQALPAKYAEIKFDMLKNTKSAIKTRVIENIIEKIDQESMQNNSNVLGGNNILLSDNAKRLLGNILTKEADKFSKKYSGEDFEVDLTAYLISFLNRSDKEKLAEAVSIWDKDLEDISKLSPEIALKNMKDKARNLLLSILSEGITPTMDRVTIRTEVGIIPALAQYKDVDTLLYAIKDVIRSLSANSKLEQIIREANGNNKHQEPNISYNFFEVSYEKNIFDVNKAA